MATTSKSVATALAVFVGGLCMGVAAMTIALELFTNSDGHYVLRQDLSPVELSRRVTTLERTTTKRSVLIRPSDQLTQQILPHPVRLVITAIEVDAPIVGVGLEPSDDGSSTVAVPPMFSAGWYSHGSAPGQSGATVLAGHVDLDGFAAVFWNLDDLVNGDRIEVHLSDGSVASYRALRGAEFGREDLPSDELFRPNGAPALHLITCGGAFNNNLGRYESNYVVTAAPIYSDA